jgi:hypothetical protein
MPPSNNPNAVPRRESLATEHLNDTERAFETEADQAEMEALLERDRGPKFVSDGVR